MERLISSKKKKVEIRCKIVRKKSYIELQQRDSNPQQLSLQMNTQPFSQFD